MVERVAKLAVVQEAAVIAVKVAEGVNDALRHAWVKAAANVEVAAAGAATRLPCAIAHDAVLEIANELRELGRVQLTIRAVVVTKDDLLCRGRREVDAIVAERLAKLAVVEVTRTVAVKVAEGVEDALWQAGRVGDATRRGAACRGRRAGVVGADDTRLNVADQLGKLIHIEFTIRAVVIAHHHLLCTAGRAVKAHVV